MKMVDISVFYDEAATRISGAPLDTLKQEIRATLREFYTRSNAFVVKTSPANIKANVREYDISRQPNGTVLTTFRAEVDGRPVGFSGDINGPGKIILHLAYPVDKQKALTCIAALKPTSYDTVPEDTITFDFDTILDGVTGRMFMMPDRPWSNAPQAQYYLQRFKQGQGTARERVRKQYTRNQVRTGFPPW